jgi:hypothetical protein
MSALLAVAVDGLHAAFMTVWFLGLPLLLWHRWPRVSSAYSIYALIFVVVSQLSHWILGECFLTTIARWLWERQPEGTAPAHVDEWFTVRMAEAVFRLTPSHRAIVWISEAFILATAIGSLRTMRRTRRTVPLPARPRSG